MELLVPTGWGAQGVRRVLFLLFLSWILLSNGLPAVNAQSPTPDVELECSPSTLKLDVEPGATRVTTAFCTATNPSLFQEVVSIDVDSNLINAHPDSITIPADDETTFEVTFRGEADMQPASISATITARVESANGFPVFTNSSDSVDVTIEIQQYARVTLSVLTDSLYLDYGEEGQVYVEVTNDGNAADTMKISIGNESGLNDAGVRFAWSEKTFDLEVRETTSLTLEVLISEDVGDDRFEVRLTVSSEYAKSNPPQVTHSEVFRLETTGKVDILGAAGIPTWAFYTGGGFGGLFVIAVIVIIARRLFLRKRDDIDLSDHMDTDEWSDEEFGDLDEFDEFDFSELDDLDDFD